MTNDRRSRPIVLCAGCDDKDAEIERLQSRIDALHEHDGTMCPICAMENEIERLRAALERIATKPPPDDAYELRALAREALEDRDE